MRLQGMMGMDFVWVLLLFFSAFRRIMEFDSHTTERLTSIQCMLNCLGGWGIRCA